MEKERQSDLLLGIDVGTSSTKAVLIQPDGVCVGQGAEAYDVETPRAGWAEQQPETWMDATAHAVRRALAESDVHPSRIRGLGLSGQMHGTVCLDGNGHPVRPAIIWADQRSGSEVAWVNETLGVERLAEWTGNPLATGFMLSTWLWLQRHAPETSAETATLLLPKDYVRYRMTGRLGTEPSDASSTSLFDPRARAWSAALLERLDLDPSKLPEVAPSATVAGGLRPDAAERMGLRADTPVIFGGSDQAMQAFGNGIITPGTLSSTIGTGGQLFAPTGEPVIDPDLRMHSFCHVLPDLWHVETAILSAGLSLRWLRDHVLEKETYNAMADAAAEVAPGAEGLLFQPYLTGERTPHMDPEARGSFVGLTRRHGRAHLVRAVMEGVVFGLREGLDLMIELGVPLDHVIASGGAVRHPLWLQLQADIFNRPIRRTTTQEAAATGAAMLAGLGTGIYGDAAEAISRAVRLHPEIIEPDPGRATFYDERYRTYCDLYPALANVTHELTHRNRTANS